VALLGSAPTVPTSISSSQESLTAIRNAYEHIEDRALGQVNKKPHPEALTIFRSVRVPHPRPHQVRQPQPRPDTRDPKPALRRTGLPQGSGRQRLARPTDVHAAAQTVRETSAMRSYVGVTDGDWYRFLAARPAGAEVNFWRPGGGRGFHAITPGEPFFFKSHYPQPHCWGWLL
jgi:hypothetical protein